MFIPHGRERADRRRFDEVVLDTPRPAHRLADRFTRVVDEEAELLLRAARRRGELDWDGFTCVLFRAVRRVVLGGAARDAQGPTDLLARPRADAHRAFFALETGWAAGSLG